MVWLQGLLKELPQTPVIWCDNLNTVSLSANPIQHSRMKHIELDFYFVRDKVLKKTLAVQHVPTYDQTTDILTKCLSSSSFCKLRDKLNVIFSSTLSLWGSVKKHFETFRDILVPHVIE